MVERMWDKLTQRQRDAVLHPMQPLVVFAGPGSGKTTVLTLRAAHLLSSRQMGGEGLALVTFTRASAKEMKERLHLYAEHLPFSLHQVTVCTFHSLFLQILLRHYGHLPSILSPSQQQQLAKEAVPSAQLNSFLAQVGLCKNSLISPSRLSVSKEEHIKFKLLYESYERKKQEVGAWDYDDILICCHDLLAKDSAVLRQWQDRLQYVLVDEFQDTNRAQYETLKLLTPTGNLTVVGDDDQSIYGFRGSSVEFLLRFQNDFPNVKRVILDRNFRSTERIIQFSQTLIEKNVMRQSKAVTGTAKAGGPTCLIRPADEEMEAEWVVARIKRLLPHQTVGVLFRTHRQGELVLEELIRQRVGFHCQESAEHWFEKWQVQGILLVLETASVKSPEQKRRGLKQLVERFSWLQSREVPLVVQLASLANMPAQAAIDAVLEKLRYSEYLQTYSDRLQVPLEELMEPCLRMRQIASRFESAAGLLAHIEEVKQKLRQKESANARVKLCTFHGAKGLEFDVAFIVGCVESIVPHRRTQNTLHELQAAEEERRLFYVACTRAKTELILSAPRHCNGHSVKVSPFLTGLQHLVDLDSQKHLDYLK